MDLPVFFLTFLRTVVSLGGGLKSETLDGWRCKYIELQHIQTLLFAPINVQFPSLSLTLWHRPQQFKSVDDMFLQCAHWRVVKPNMACIRLACGCISGFGSTSGAFSLGGWPAGHQYKENPCRKSAPHMLSAPKHSTKARIKAMYAGVKPSLDLASKVHSFPCSSAALPRIATHSGWLLWQLM